MNNHSRLQRVVIKKNNIQNGSGLFDGLSSTSRIEVNLQSCVDASVMFSKCYALIEPVITNSSNVIFASGMFWDCAQLSAAPIFETSNIENVSNMFGNCSALTSVPPYNLSSAKNAEFMFSNCHSLGVLPAINFSGLTASQGIGPMFGLKKIKILNFGNPNYEFTLDLRGSKLTATALNDFFHNELVDISVAYPDRKGRIDVRLTPAAADPALDVQAACRKGWIVEGALTGCSADPPKEVEESA